MSSLKCTVHQQGRFLNAGYDTGCSNCLTQAAHEWSGTQKWGPPLESKMNACPLYEMYSTTKHRFYIKSGSESRIKSIRQIKLWIHVLPLIQPFAFLVNYNGNDKLIKNKNHVNSGWAGTSNRLAWKRVPEIGTDSLL